MTSSLAYSAERSVWWDECMKAALHSVHGNFM